MASFHVHNMDGIFFGSEEFSRFADKPLDVGRRNLNRYPQCVRIEKKAFDGGKTRAGS